MGGKSTEFGLRSDYDQESDGMDDMVSFILIRPLAVVYISLPSVIAIRWTYKEEVIQLAWGRTKGASIGAAISTRWLAFKRLSSQHFADHLSTLCRH